MFSDYKTQLIFKICETIGCTARFVRNKMDIDELEEWAAYFQLKYEAEQKSKESLQE
jgi:hypothetical protein